MLSRTYIVKIAGEAQQVTIAPCDIMVEGVVGTQALPVGSAAFYGAPNVTAAPTTWVAVCHSNAYYEIRGRTLRIEKRAAVGAAGGFIPRFNLGWKLAVHPIAAAGTDACNLLLPIVSLSASLIGTPGNAAVMNEPTAFADPAYGPCIRIDANTSPAALGANTTPRIYAVYLDVFERRDESFSNIG